MYLEYLGKPSIVELYRRNLLKGVKSCKLGPCEFCAWEVELVNFHVNISYELSIIDYVHSSV